MFSATLTQKIEATLRKAALKGITVLAAAGSDESPEDRRQHVLFPAASQWVLAVGATRLLTEDGAATYSEIAAGRGGVSAVFRRPEWQNGIGTASASGARGRAIPDVAADASVESGYSLYIGGHWNVIGGVSMSTPLWAGLIARLNQALGRHVGFINPILYGGLGASGALRNVKPAGDGSSDCSGSGWNVCAGWGSPDGVKLLRALQKRPSDAPL